jgi:hypothetical protein
MMVCDMMLLVSSSSIYINGGGDALITVVMMMGGVCFREKMRLVVTMMSSWWWIVWEKFQLSSSEGLLIRQFVFNGYLIPKSKQFGSKVSESLSKKICSDFCPAFKRFPTAKK